MLGKSVDLNRRWASYITINWNWNRWRSIQKFEIPQAAQSAEDEGKADSANSDGSKKDDEMNVDTPVSTAKWFIGNVWSTIN